MLHCNTLYMWLCFTVVCTEPEYFDNCTTPSTHCPSTCRALRNPGSCVEPEECKPTCRCKPGYVRDDNGICILEEQCPCYHNSKAVPEGHVIKTSACETWSVKFTFCVYIFGISALVSFKSSHHSRRWDALS